MEYGRSSGRTVMELGMSTTCRWYQEVTEALNVVLVILMHNKAHSSSNVPQLWHEYLVILDDLGNEVPRVGQVCHNGHSDAQNENIRVFL